MSTLGEVRLQPYLTSLCESLGASMISDHTQITLQVHADESMSSADTSVSLGLMVTELVINALKHAFPGHRAGSINVFYSAAGAGWTLSVIDDGVGVPKDPDAKPGLGTSIIEALARQFGAVVKIDDARPGTAVSISRA